MFDTQNTGKINSQAFTPEDVKAGLLNDLLDYLLNYNAKKTDGEFDIHIGSDGYCTIVEWGEIVHDINDYEGFKWVDEDHELCKILRYPDNHYEYCLDEDAEELMAHWHEENPGWKQNSFGHWINPAEAENSEIEEGPEDHEDHETDEDVEEENHETEYRQLSLQDMIDDFCECKGDTDGDTSGHPTSTTATNKKN